MGDQSLPEWMTNDFFNSCLQKKKGRQDITVTNFTTSEVAPPGNNYGSFILRVKVEYNLGDVQELHSSSLVVKSEHCQGPIKDIVDEFNNEQLKLNEPMFYYKFIPEAKTFTDMSFVPDTYFSSRPTVTVLEDLKEQGFVMANRCNQLDFDHCSLYMKAAATFHSVSVAVYKNHPKLLEPIKNVDYYSNESTFKGLFEVMIAGGLDCFADAIEKIDGFKKYCESIRNIIPEMYGTFVEINKHSDFVNTIRQGDPWTTNMLFKYDKEGKVCDVKMIDFQATTYGSPATDIIFFIWTSATNEVKKYKLDELYRIYLENLNKNLELFDCDERLTLEQLKEEMKRLNTYALYVVACMLPSLRDPVPVDMMEIFSKQTNVTHMKNFYKKYYNENFCSGYLPELLECSEMAGVLDYIQSRMKR